MDVFGEQAQLSVPIFVGNDFGVDDDGQVNVLSFVYVGDSEDSVESHTQFDEVVGNLIDFWRMEPASEAISFLNVLAHAFDTAAQRMWATVDDLEGYRVELEAEQFPEM